MGHDNDYEWYKHQESNPISPNSSFHYFSSLLSKEYAREYALFALEEGIDSYKTRINLAKINSLYKYNDYIERNTSGRTKKRTIHK